MGNFAIQKEFIFLYDRWQVDFMQVISNLTVPSKSCLCPILILKKTLKIFSFITLLLTNVKNLAVLQYTTWICKFKLGLLGYWNYICCFKVLSPHFQVFKMMTLFVSTWKAMSCYNDTYEEKKVYDKPAKSLAFILIPLLWRERITKLFRRNTSSPSITIERKNLFMNRSASIWIAVNYAHASCVKGKNISVTPRKAGIISSWFVLLQCPAEAMAWFSSKLFSKC